LRLTIRSLVALRRKLRRRVLAQDVAEISLFQMTMLGTGELVEAGEPGSGLLRATLPPDPSLSLGMTGEGMRQGRESGLRGTDMARSP